MLQDGERQQQQDDTNNNGNDSSNDGDDEDGNDSARLMASLSRRLLEVQEKENRLPLVVLDPMLPRQVLEIKIQNELLMELVRDCLRREHPYFGMLGMARLRTGQRINLAQGVEVEILKDDLEFLKGGKINKEGIKLALKAGRRFEIESIVETDRENRGWTEAKVRFLDSRQEEEDELDIGDDPMSVARAIARAKELTIPNMNMPNNLSLVDRWIELAKENERQKGQIDTLVGRLGKIPPPTQPSERAFWIGALINPIPAMGVAMEIRPALLTAKKAEQRMEIALDGILRSIKHMDGSARLW
jgi:hypothetical protein